MTHALRPESLEEAFALRARHPEATVVAGGTDVMVGINLGRLQPARLLDLSLVEPLRRLHESEERVFVGAGVTFAQIARELPAAEALAAAATMVGSLQVRNRATLGGNVGTASPAGDGLAVLAAYDADVCLCSARGQRQVPWHRFLTGPKRTALEERELIVGVEWRPVRGPGVFLKVGPRSAMVIAVASVCLQLDEDGHEARLALGSVGPTVLRAPAAERHVAELDWDRLDEGALRELGRLAAAAAEPIDDLRGTADYRRHVVAVLAGRALAAAVASRRAEVHA